MKRRPSSGLSASFHGKRRRPCEPVEPTSGLSSAAELVRLFYAYERSSWESHRAGQPVRYVFPKAYEGREAVTVDNELVLSKATRSTWMDLTSWLEEHELPHLSYIALTFDQCLITENRAPEPGQLASVKYLHRWRTCSPLLDGRIQRALQFQHDAAQRQFIYYRSIGLKPRQCWATLLLDENLELSPLFRYCIAATLGGKSLGAVAEYYHADAIMQFERYRENYLMRWQCILPADFVATSGAVYRDLLQIRNEV